MAFQDFHSDGEAFEAVCFRDPVPMLKSPSKLRERSALRRLDWRSGAAGDWVSATVLVSNCLKVPDAPAAVKTRFLAFLSA